MKKNLLAVAILTASAFTTSAFAADGALNITGTITDQSCTVDADSKNKQVALGKIAKEAFTLSKTAGAKAFNLVLQDCDLSLGKTVKVTFTGAESAALPGLLLPDGGSPLGIALGIETMAGSPVALNKPSQGYALANGSNSLQLQVYIQGEPAAIAQKSIGLGVFSSVATFALEYE